MQSEQYTPSQPEHTSWYGKESYVPNRQYDTDESSREVLRASRAVAQAFASIPSGALEAIPVSAEKLRQGQLREVGAIGARLVRFRTAYQENNFDLSADGDDEVKATMFSQPVSNSSENTIDLMADDDLNADMFMSPKSDSHDITQDMFDKAA